MESRKINFPAFVFHIKHYFLLLVLPNQITVSGKAANQYCMVQKGSETYRSPGLEGSNAPSFSLFVVLQL
jgi:hypothetical protein